MTTVYKVEINKKKKSKKEKKKKKFEKKKFLEIFLGPPDIVWNFNPGWSRDHPGLYGFSMYGEKIFCKKKFFFRTFFFNFFFIIINTQW